MTDNFQIRCVPKPAVVTDFKSFICGACGNIWPVGTESPVCHTKPKTVGKIYLPEDPSEANMCDSCQ